MGVTSSGLRYPEPTEPVAQGATNIANLAADVTAKYPNGPGTPWVAIPAAGGVTSTAAVRVVGASIQLRGQFSAGTMTNGGVVATLPVGYRPQFTSICPVAPVANASFRISVATSGAITYTNLSGTVNAFWVDGVILPWSEAAQLLPRDGDLIETRED